MDDKHIYQDVNYNPPQIHLTLLFFYFEFDSRGFGHSEGPLVSLGGEQIYNFLFLFLGF